MTWKPVENPTWTEGPPEDLKRGMIVRSATGYAYLIGEANPQGGVCDCCNTILAREVVAWCQFLEDVP